MNISNGDLLVVDGKEYPIRALERWEGFSHNSDFMTRNMTKTVSLKRESFAGNLGSTAIYATGVKAFPLDPVDPEIKHTLNLETPNTLKETFIDDPDNNQYFRLIVEDIQE